jgi:hypothetical protein
LLRVDEDDPAQMMQQDGAGGGVPGAEEEERHSDDQAEEANDDIDVEGGDEGDATGDADGGNGQGGGVAWLSARASPARTTVPLTPAGVEPTDEWDDLSVLQDPEDTEAVSDDVADLAEDADAAPDGGFVGPANTIVQRERTVKQLFIAVRVHAHVLATLYSWTRSPTFSFVPRNCE